MSELPDKENINQILEEPVRLETEEKLVTPDTTEESVVLETENVENNDDIPEPNCLALTVRKDYNLTVAKNIFTTSWRMSLKIALSTLALNFLRMFF